MYENIRVFTHSSIRIKDGNVFYFDPYNIKGNPQDADYIFITHSHYDHFSPEDILKVSKKGTKLIAPMGMDSELVKLDITSHCHLPESRITFSDFTFETIPAYNIGKDFHPKKNNWLGYLLDTGDTSYYICGDTDLTNEAKNVQCDVLFVPVGGTYTMDPQEAAELTRLIKPCLAIPTHYGSVAGKKTDGETFQKLVGDEVPTALKIEY